jgi:hypothetical protein
MGSERYEAGLCSEQLHHVLALSYKYKFSPTTVYIDTSSVFNVGCTIRPDENQAPVCRHVGVQHRPL